MQKPHYLMQSPLQRENFFSAANLRSPSFYIQSSFRIHHRRTLRSSMRRSPPQSGDLISFYDRPQVKAPTTMQQELSLLYQKLQFINSMMVETEPVQNYVDFSKWFQENEEERQYQNQQSQKQKQQQQLQQDEQQEQKDQARRRNPKKKIIKEEDSNYNDPDFIDTPCKMFDINDTRKHSLVFEEQISQENRNNLVLKEKVHDLQLIITKILGIRRDNSYEDDDSKMTISGIKNFTSKIQRTYKCKYCTQEFPKACSLGGHISRVHKDESTTQKLIQKQIKKSIFSRCRNKLIETSIQQEALKFMKSTSKVEDSE